MMKKLLSFLVFAVVIGLFLWAGDALAQPTMPSADTYGGTANSNTVWEIAFGRVSNAFSNSRKVIFIVGGFGLIALAFFAIFGKVQWKWFAALCVGLAIVAAAGYVIDYATGTKSNSQAGGDLGIYSTIDK